MNGQSKRGAIHMTTKVQKWGNSLGIRIPRQVAENLGIVHGSQMEMSADDQQIVLKPLNGKPTLEQLLSQITAENRHTEIDFGKREGNELP